MVAILGKINLIHTFQLHLIKMHLHVILTSYASTSMLGASHCHHGMVRPRVADGRDGLQLEVSCEYIE
jgi:hypothetical protein